MQDATLEGPVRKKDLGTAVGDLQAVMCDREAWKDIVTKYNKREVPSSKRRRA